MRAELRFLGAEEHASSSGLPAVFVLTPEQPMVDVGRDVAGGGLLLDSPHQKLMISRAHARLSFAPAHQDKDGRSIHGQWMVTDMGSTNGLLFNGCRVMEAKLSDGDVITFGGAKSTKCGFTPHSKSVKSIYTYRFVDLDGRFADAPGGHAASSEECRRKRSRVEEEEEEARQAKRQCEEEEREAKRRREQEEREAKRQREEEEREAKRQREEEEREAKRQREEEEWAEERAKLEEQERERQQQAERARQAQEELLEREKQRLEAEAAALEERNRLEQGALAKAQLEFEEQKKQWEEQQRLERESKEREERERVEREARELKEKEEERERRAKADAEAKAKAAATIVIGDSDSDDEREGAGRKYWQEINHGCVKQLFRVLPGSDEYKEVQEILAQDAAAIRARRNPWGFASFLQGYEVLNLERIQNPTLHACYMALKTSKIKASQDPKEIYAVHGSTRETLDNICSGGFNRSYNGKNATLYGKGAYFAKVGNYTYAAQQQYAKPHTDGTQRLILTRVLEGEKTIGDQNTIEPPLMPGRGDGRRFDSTGDPQNTIVVTYKDQQAYPAYLITFKARPGISPMQPSSSYLPQPPQYRPQPPQPIAPPLGMVPQLQAMQAMSAWQTAAPGLQAAVARVWATVQRPAGAAAPGPAVGAALGMAARTAALHAAALQATGRSGGRICIELARSGRSTCRTCYKYISNATPRVGEDDDSDYDGGYTSTRWHHVACFDFAAHGIKVEKDLSRIRGFSTLNKPDQLRVQKEMLERLKANAVPATKPASQSQGKPLLPSSDEDEDNEDSDDGDEDREDSDDVSDEEHDDDDDDYVSDDV